KYPNDWGVLDLGGPLMIAPSSDIENVRKMKKDDNFEGGKFLISLLTVYNDVYNHEVVSDEYTKVSKTSIQIDNKIADRYESVYLKDTPNGEYVKGDMGITVIIPLKSRLLIEYLLADQKYSKIFDQILSTFQFTQ
ncbi:MAG: hypothetical protein NT162_02540, partial [Candidatus Woesebacteria bacterium]|nr:hypothetical protein [Candidatus Woesebacteria bacterium]